MTPQSIKITQHGIRKQQILLPVSSRAEQTIQKLCCQQETFEVVDIQGHLIGQIVEWLVDTKEDRITYAVVLCLDQTQLHSKLIPIPWAQLCQRTDTNKRIRFSINISHTSLLSATGYHPSDWQPDAASYVSLHIKTRVHKN